ncbi:MAG: hypothetical protein WA101_02560, partial [Minisyncoccia bacterium]
MIYLKHILRNHLGPILSLSFLIIFAATLHIFASPDPYAPGETLDPTCLPGTPDCTVVTPTGWDLTGTSGTVDGTNFIGT